MPAPFWLYRIGSYFHKTNGPLALWSETWLSTMAPVDPPSVIDAELHIQAGQTRSYFGAGIGPPYYQAFTFVDYFEPDRRRTTTGSGSGIAPTAQLNPNAPEAAFRLQRVGASSALGRVNVPILTDAWYTDLPHRRRVNVAPLEAMLQTTTQGVGWDYFFLGASFRRYDNVIFHRASRTWTPVTGYRLLENPTRIWQRWRPDPLPLRAIANASRVAFEGWLK